MPVMVHSLPIGGGNPANWKRAYSHASQVVHLNAAVTCEGNEFSSVEQHKKPAAAQRNRAMAGF